MRKETEFALYRELRRGDLTYEDIDRLFDIYTQNEIRTIDDLHTEPFDFHTFILNNLDGFANEDEEDDVLVGSVAYDKVRAFKPIANKYYRTYRVHQEQFAREVEELVGHDKSVKILEIGSGEIPYSSILLGRDGYDITSMDNFYISSKCLAQFNVKSFRQMFNITTSVKPYDIVVARRPCTAIESIVSTCHRERVPYFMKLCGCNAPGGHISGWKNILSSIDDKIKYKSTYAYNLEGTPYDVPTRIEDLILFDTDRAYS